MERMPRELPKAVCGMGGACVPRKEAYRMRCTFINFTWNEPRHVSNVSVL